MEKKIVLNGVDYTIHVIRKTKDEFVFELNDKRYHYDLVHKKGQSSIC